MRNDHLNHLKAPYHRISSKSDFYSILFFFNEGGFDENRLPDFDTLPSNLNIKITVLITLDSRLIDQNAVEFPF